MIVVADTSPICYLVLIVEIELLPKLFGQIAIPQAVVDELRADGAPAVVKSWMINPPSCLKIYSITSVTEPTGERLHPGEKQAILLAEELEADLIILDEKIARNIAAERGLNLTGLLGILDVAATRKLINLPRVIASGQKTTFRASPTLLKSLLKRHYS